MHRYVFVRGLCACLLLALAPGMACAQDSAKTSKDDEIAALKKMLQEQADLIKQLTDRVEKLEKAKGVAPPAKPGEGEPEIPPLVIPGEQAPAVPAQPGAQGGASVPIGTTRASLTPDISVIGDNAARFWSVHGDPDRNRLQMGELELGFQQPIYPGIRFDAFLTAGADAGFNMSAEEAYATFSKVGHLPFGGILGKKRLDFGKINPIHPHARSYVDQPAVLANLLDPDSLNGNGASINYTLPLKNLFANLEVGMFDLNASDAGATLDALPEAVRSRRLPGLAGRQTGVFYPAGAGISGNFPMARLWTSKAFGAATELELGGSYGFGRADNGDNISLAGLDLTCRNFPGTFKRLMLQGEVFWHHRDDRAFGTGGHTRSGHYALLTWRPDQYTEYGFRYDNSKFPWPLPGRDQSYSLIWTDRLTEVTLLRLQFKYGDRTNGIFLPASKGYKEIYLQFLWGGGSHTHPLQ
jgi:hypothetical protein